MSTKLKALGLGLLAAMAMSAFAVVNASADTTSGGVFHADDPLHHTIIKGQESEDHFTEFEVAGLQGIRCTKSSFEGTTNETTPTSLTVVPKWEECHTTGSETNFSIHTNGCHFTFTIGKTAEGHNTMHIDCPVEQSIRLTHPSCTIVVPEQTVTGIAYGTILENGIHAITLRSTVQNMTMEFEGGICQLLGTSHQAGMSGSKTVTGFNTQGNPVGITATGSGH